MIEKAVTDFRLSITRALRDQLVEALTPLRPAPLTHSNIESIQSRSGVYVLYLNGQRVYVGKASTSLQDRLSQHLRKISGREGLRSASVEFVCAYIEEDLDAAAPERLLIKVYKKDGAVPWNTNGFGNKDPGRNRDHTLVKRAHFDATYPINLDHEIDFPQATWDMLSLLKTTKQLLPYNFRYGDKGHSSLLKELTLELPSPPITTRSLIENIIATLPHGWQATALPGYVILYKETDDNYHSALAWWRRSIDGRVVKTDGPRTFASGQVKADDEPDDDDETDD